MSSCFGCSSDTDAGEKLSASEMFEREVQPLFERRCALDCHVPGGFSGELLLGEGHGQALLIGQTSTQVDMVLVAPGDLEGSYLWHKLKNTHKEVGGEGEAMPYASWPLPDEELAIIESYILATE